MLICIIFNACDDNKPDMPQDKIEYYVKYEVTLSSYHSMVKSADISVVTEYGTKRFEIPTKWEAVFGPFNEPKNLYIKGLIPKGPYPNQNIRGRIYISSDNSPFVLKAEKSAENNLVVKYLVKERDYQ